MMVIIQYHHINTSLFAGKLSELPSNPGAQLLCFFHRMDPPVPSSCPPSIVSLVGQGELPAIGDNETSDIFEDDEDTPANDDDDNDDDGDDDDDEDDHADAMRYQAGHLPAQAMACLSPLLHAAQKKEVPISCHIIYWDILVDIYHILGYLGKYITYRSKDRTTTSHMII